MASISTNFFCKNVQKILTAYAISARAYAVVEVVRYPQQRPNLWMHVIPYAKTEVLREQDLDYDEFAVPSPLQSRAQTLAAPRATPVQDVRRHRH